MLTRTALNLYWLARYLQRCEITARFLQIQVEALVDRTQTEIQFGWERMYRSLDRDMPQQSQSQQQAENEYQASESMALCDNLTFSKDNPDSVWNCFEKVRENARQVRYCITEEMWSSINLTYLGYKDQAVSDVWERSPEDFYQEFARDVQAIEGVAQATMYRDAGWYFFELGGTIEQAQQLCSMLLAHIEVLQRYRRLSENTWSSLLHGYYADEIYEHVYGKTLNPRSAFNLLVFDAALPCSLNAMLKKLQATIDSIGIAPNALALHNIRNTMFSLAKLVTHESSGIKANHTDLTTTQSLLTEIHDDIFNAWIGYTVDDSPLG